MSVEEAVFLDGLPRSLIDDELGRELAARPSRVKDAETCEAVISWLMHGIASITAQIDRAMLIACSRPPSEDDLSWCHRAAYARSVKKSQLKRLCSDTVKASVATANAQANLEAARISAQAKADEREHQARRSRERERLFVKVAEATLPEDVYRSMWAKVEALEPCG